MLYSKRAIVLIILGIYFLQGQANAQELQALVRVSTENLGAVDQSTYKVLENQLSDLLNKTRWTNLSFSPKERIGCNFSLKLLELKDNNKYQAELSISSSRPVFNTIYDSPILVYVDKALNFEWDQGTMLSYQEQNIDNNLLATFTFYAYAIIAMSLDSYALEGSRLIQEPLKQIQSQAQSHQDWQGWDRFKQNNRGSLGSVILDSKHQAFRKIWYTYHRLTLDVCESKLSFARTKFIKLIKELKEYRKELYTSIYLKLFETAKLKELIDLFQKAPQSERDKLRGLLDELYPTHQEELDKLNNTY